MKTRIFYFAAFFISFITFSCSKENDSSIKVDLTPIVLNRGDEFQINATSSFAISYTSENKFHAVVDAKGKVTGNYVGETSIVISSNSDSKTIPVVIKPKYNLYQTPCIEWGKTKKEILDQYGTPDVNNGTVLGYNQTLSAVPMIMFMFDENDKLSGSSVIVKSSYVSELGEFLGERYLPISYDENDYMFYYVNEIDKSKITTSVALKIQDINYFLVMYIDMRSVFNTDNTSYIESLLLNVVNNISSN